MLRNPYLNRSMIRSVDEFHGRTQPLQRLMARLGASTPQSVSIVGERRVGKSSLLWHIAQREVHARYLENPECYLFLLLDFQRQQQLDQRGFCHIFAQHLREVLDDEVPELEDFRSIEAQIQRLERAGHRLVCLFDEFETVTRNPGFGVEFFGFLRSIANAYPISFVTSSRRNLQSLCHTRQIAESPFFNIFSQLSLGPFLPAESKELICAPSAAAGLALADHLAVITNLSGHLPFFVQMACSAAFECLVESVGDSLDERLLTQRFTEEASSHFHYLWESFSEDEKALVRPLAAGGQPSIRQAEALVHHGYIVGREGHRRLFSSAFAHFLCETFPDPVQQETPPTPTAPQTPNTMALQVEPVPRGAHPFPAIVGQSSAIRQLFALMQRAVDSDVTVLISGETGTGKELVAHGIHKHSARRNGPFVVVNCGAIAEQLQESELFGHVRGAFTDAASDRQGLFEEADGGTLFLDEVGEATLATQVRLLRVLQEGEIRRLGDNKVHKIDVRMICATNRDLLQEVAQGSFREDLYYRLYVLPLQLPPLRQRREDIPLLVRHFLNNYDSGVTTRALETLCAAEWPGNIRELENQMASARAMAGNKKIDIEHLWSHLRQTEGTSQGEQNENGLTLPPDMELKEARNWLERKIILERLRVHHGDLETASQSLGISRSRLYELLRKYELKAE